MVPQIRRRSIERGDKIGREEQGNLILKPVLLALKEMNTGEVVGVDGITYESLINAGEAAQEALMSSFVAFADLESL